MSDQHSDCSYPEHLDLETKVSELVLAVEHRDKQIAAQQERLYETTERVNQQTQLIRRMREVLRRLFVISPANHELGPFAKPYGEALTAAADMLEESREPPTAQVKMGADGSIDPRATFASTHYPDTTAQDDQKTQLICQKCGSIHEFNKTEHACISCEENRKRQIAMENRTFCETHRRFEAPSELCTEVATQVCKRCEGRTWVQVRGEDHTRVIDCPTCVTSNGVSDE